MLRSKFTLWGLALLFAVSGSQASTLIVDTGPSCTQNCSGGWALDSDTAYAGQFILPIATTITALTPMIGGWAQPGTTGLRLSIYSDLASLPGTPIFQQISSLSAPSSAVWMGVSDISWELSSGTYWAVVDVAPNGNFTSVLTGDYWGGGSGYSSTPKPLALYASKSNSGSWQLAPTDSLNFALRVYGVTSAVPESSAQLMLSIGLLAIFTATRRRHTRISSAHNCTSMRTAKSLTNGSTRTKMLRIFAG
jgi:hypothetical protein